jgi:hypothetical protein
MENEDWSGHRVDVSDLPRLIRNCQNRLTVITDAARSESRGRARAVGNKAGGI